MSLGTSEISPNPIDIPLHTHKDGHMKGKIRLSKDVKKLEHVYITSRTVKCCNYYYLNVHTTQSNPQIQCNLCQNTNRIFHRSRTNNHKTFMEAQKTPSS